MTTVKAELEAPTSDLRKLLEVHQPLISQWRSKTLKSFSGRPWISPRQATRASMVGHAIENRIRWWLSGVDALPKPVVTALGHCSARTARQLREVFKDIKGTPAGVLDSVLERRVCAVAVAAASVEPLYRAGPSVRCAFDELGWDRFSDEYSDVLEELLEISQELPDLVGRYTSMAITYGNSIDVGRLIGQCDFVADTELVEIKCVTKPQEKLTRALQQLLVYAARAHPSSMALVLPRQHTVVAFDLSRHGALLVDLDEQIQLAYATDTS